jgi:hypothetical protein
MTIYLQTWLEDPSHGLTFKKLDVKSKLISYFFITKKTERESDIWFKTGRNDKEILCRSKEKN